MEWKLDNKIIKLICKTYINEELVGKKYFFVQLVFSVYHWKYLMK